ncbi:MAG: response regulator transcription factor [Euryarchaeota archaeon]|nr:response regulator transcription factor [Euryarchaeota archaeon]
MKGIARNTVNVRAIRTLIVDDDEPLRMLMHYVLEDAEGYEVVGEAVDGVEALELVKAERPDLVLLDLMMPRMDGFEALPLIRASNPDCLIVVLSMMPSEDAEGDALRLGADLFLDKSTSTDAILATLDRLVHERFGVVTRTT